jgi:hypothetical protein
MAGAGAIPSGSCTWQTLQSCVKRQFSEKAKEKKKQSQKKRRLARSRAQFGIGAFQGGGLLSSGFTDPPLEHMPWGAEWASSVSSSSEW